MKFEFLQLPRQGGKTHYLAERVAELQDEGHDLVAVIIHSVSAVDVWYDLLFSVGIDPSRFMLINATNDGVKGTRFALAGFDNADLVDNPLETCYALIPCATNDTMMVTYTDPQFNRRGFVTETT